jgi:hypothetical protein
MGESTILECLKEFSRTVILVYATEYLRPPNVEEVNQILASNATRGFLEMFSSIDCMHWEWRNCLTSWASMYHDHKGKPSMILEAVATKDLRIWHAYFGMLGSHNNINVLQRSPVFDDLVNGQDPIVKFTMNENEYNMSYYLVDDIYPDWATLMKSVSSPLGNKRKWFSEGQESYRNDVERTFGVARYFTALAVYGAKPS